jgi:hypothetical protein
MTSDTRPIAVPVRRWAFALCAAGAVALAGCKTDKETKGTGVARGKDPLVYGPLIPKQNVPVTDRATGPNGPSDPLTTATGGKAGYNDDPDRFKGVYIPGRSSTMAALASTPSALPTRIRDGEELKIADGPGVELTPAGGKSAGVAVDPPEDLQPLFGQLQKFGVAAADRSLERENGKYTFRATVPIAATGAHRQYVAVGTTAREAVTQVLDQVANEPK